MVVTLVLVDGIETLDVNLKVDNLLDHDSLLEFLMKAAALGRCSEEIFYFMPLRTLLYISKRKLELGRILTPPRIRNVKTTITHCTYFGTYFGS